MATTMRLTPRSAAVESFLRNFERERVRLQEVLEVTLCYGVLCLSQNFSLKGMSVEELRAVTKYETIKKRDFFVRNAGISARHGHADGLKLATEAQQLRVKPSHLWRDGNQDADILVPAGHDSHAETPASRLLPDTHVLAAEKKRTSYCEFDEIDFFTQLFGKQFIDTAWATFAGRNGSQIALQSELDERFTCIDQRKIADKFPARELPVASFVEFLSEYVKVCVGHHHQSTDKDCEPEADVESLPVRRQQESDDIRSAVQSQHQRPVMVPERTSPDDALRPRPGRVSKKPVPASDQKPFRPKSLQHVQSKVKPELDARREKLLRVKTTQTQLMKESLARTRLAEYEAKRMLDAVADRSRGNGGGQAPRVRKMPLADISTGAAALEIADDFMKSPLLDSFSGKENRDDGQRANAVSSRKDPLREELYGAAPLDDSFLGCKPPRAPARRKLQPKQPSRAYNGWLGDFGPQHTKTVVSEWGTPADEEEDDSDEAHEATMRKDPGHRTTSASQKFEWKFDGIDTRNSTQRGTNKANQRKPTDDDFSSVYGGGANHDDDANAFSDGGQSDASDPVFKWLKRAI